MPPQIETLQQTPLLAALSRLQIETLHQTAQSIRLIKGQVLFRMGEQSTCFFYLQSGKIKLARNSPQGMEKVLAIINPGQLFAEAVMFIDGGLFPATAEALEATEVVAFDNDVFKGLIRESPDLSMAMLSNLSNILHQKVIEIDSLTLRNANYRILNYINTLIPPECESPVEVTLPGPKSTIASILSIAPETLSRSLLALKKQNIIRMQGNGRAITIPDINTYRRALLTQ